MQMYKLWNKSLPQLSNLRSMTIDGFNDYGQVSLNFNWEIDFWGKKVPW